MIFRTVTQCAPVYLHTSCISDTKSVLAKLNPNAAQARAEELQARGPPGDSLSDIIKSVTGAPSENLDTVIRPYVLDPIVDPSPVRKSLRWYSAVRLPHQDPPGVSGSSSSSTVSQSRGQIVTVASTPFEHYEAVFPGGHRFRIPAPGKGHRDISVLVKAGHETELRRLDQQYLRKFVPGYIEKEKQMSLLRKAAREGRPAIPPPSALRTIRDVQISGKNQNSSGQRLLMAGRLTKSRKKMQGKCYRERASLKQPLTIAWHPSLQHQLHQILLSQRKARGDRAPVALRQTSI